MCLDVSVSCIEQCLEVRRLTWCAELQKRRAGPSHRKLVMAASEGLGEKAQSGRSVALTSSSRRVVSTAAAMLALPAPVSSITLPPPLSSTSPCHATCSTPPRSSQVLAQADGVQWPCCS